MEVCVDSVESARNAYQGGASRLELCSGLAEGGLTPSLGLFREVKDLVQSVPINVLIRPRAGDFCYTEAELQVMKRDITVFKEEGASGIVIGVLTENGTVDKKACIVLINECRPLSVTFHRAFDWCPDPLAALDDLKDLGVDRLLTSGQCESADKGVNLLAELIQKAGGSISIMPGGGITEQNLVAILEATGAKEFHASASREKDSQMKIRSNVCMGASSKDFSWKECCVNRVRRMVELAKAVYKL